MKKAYERAKISFGQKSKLQEGNRALLAVRTMSKRAWAPSQLVEEKEETLQLPWLEHVSYLLLARSLGKFDLKQCLLAWSPTFPRTVTQRQKRQLSSISKMFPRRKTSHASQISKEGERFILFFSCRRPT